MPFPDFFKKKALSADGLVLTGRGYFGGVFVASSTSGVIRIYDDTSAAGTLILPSTAVSDGDEIWLPCEADVGIYFDLVSGSAEVVILYRER